MKKVWSRGIAMVIAALFVTVFSINTTNAQASVSLQVFYDELQPYGTWMDYGNYGYVWVPRVDRGFTPYATNGYWINTEYGNTWVSDYSWGWAPFHYGRWLYDDLYGWMWVPDTQWGPAWVAWRSGGGYYGWAPLMPGFGVNVAFSYYNGIPNHYWNFVPCRYITYRSVYNHCVPRPRVVNIINHTTIITHNYTDHRDRHYFTGPSRSEIERVNHERVPVYTVNDRNRPGRTEIERGRVSFYKPDVDNAHQTRSRAVPERYIKSDRNGNREMVDTRRGAPTDFSTNRRPENLREMQPGNTQREVIDRNTQDVRPERMQRSRGTENFQHDNSTDNNIERLQPAKRLDNDVVERMERQGESGIREQQRNHIPREQPERQHAPRSFSQDQRRDQPDINRSQQQQMQRFQQPERQDVRQRQSLQQQAPANPNLNRSQAPQRQRNSTVQPSRQSNNGSGRETNTRRRN